MTRIPVITQNFSSPDVFSDSPLMLLPQSSPMAPLPDRDQDGFSQLLLHDLHRHRQTYVQSYTAFETLKKRQDFVLRQENLRSLQTLEQRVTTKQDQCLDQSFHAYEQCFVKVINGNLTPTRTHTEQTKSMKMISPSFDKFHPHQLSHIPATPLDPPAIIPFHRYQKSHRPRIIPKYRSHPSIQRSAQCLHDAFQSSNSLNQSQPFLSFTESYLQKYSDHSFNRFSMGTGTRGDGGGGGQMNETMSDIRERTEIDDLRTDVKHGSTDQQTKRSNSQTRGHEPRIKSADYNRYRNNVSSRNTNTPSSTPQITYQDAVQDGLTTGRDDEHHRRSKLSSVNERHRRTSQQSSGQNSSAIGRSTAKRSITSAVKKQQITVDLTTNKKTEGTITSLNDDGDDILKKAMTVQNYGNNATESSMLSSILDRPSVSTTSKTTTTLRKAPLSTSSLLNRPSIRTTDSTPGSKLNLDNVDTQMTTTSMKLGEITDPKIAPDSTTVVPTTTTTTTTTAETTTTNPLAPGTDLNDPRKRLRKGPFDPNDSMRDLISFELDIVNRQRGAGKKSRFNLNGQVKGQIDAEIFPIKENQATLDLLEKIRQSVTGSTLGQYPISQRNCRFELPSDLKLLETLTPLDYLSKYCRLSSRRHYHYKKIFDKYRNTQYRFESNHLYAAIRDVQGESFTRTNYDQLIGLLNISNEQHQFAFEAFAGILALCERILCDSEKFRSGLDEHDLAKDTIEKCDFDSLDRKLDGLNVSETMKNLLRTL